MNISTRMPATFFVALICWAGAAVPAAAATEQDGVEYSAALYAWLPSIGGSTTFPQDGGSSIGVDASTLLSNLEIAAMAAFAIQGQRWGVFTDIIYLDIEADKSATRGLGVGGVELPADVTASTDFGLKGLVWTTAINYRWTDSGTTRLDTFAGARLLSIEQDLDWQLSGNVGSIPVSGRGGSVSTSADSFDAIIGAKGRATFGNRKQWFVPYYLDVGAGESDFTWQATAGIGRTFGWGETLLVWRHLEYDLNSNTKILDVDFSGPALAVAFSW